MWKTVKLGDICDLQNGFAFKSSDYVDNSNTLNIRMSNIRPNGKFDESHNIKFLPDNYATKYAEYKLIEGDLIIAMTDMAGNPKILGMPTIVKNLDGRAFLLNQRVGKLHKFSDEIFVPYLCHFLSTLKNFYKNKGAGGLQINISKKDILSAKIRLPPLAEQQRIVAKLDAAFAEIDGAIEVVKNKMIEISSLYENSITAEFINIDGCVEKKLSDVCEKITDGTHQTPKYFEEGYIFLSSKNVTSRKIDWENVRYIDESQHIQMQKRIAPRVGDVLLAKNGTTGVAAIVDRDVVFDIYVSLAWLRSRGDVLPEYLLEYVNSKMAREQFNIRTKGIGVPNLHLQEIREVVIRFPKDKEKQKIIVKKLKNIDDACNSYKQLNEQKLQSLVSLKSAILAQELQSEAA